MRLDSTVWVWQMYSSRAAAALARRAAGKPAEPDDESVLAWAAIAVGSLQKHFTDLLKAASAAGGNDGD